MLVACAVVLVVCAVALVACAAAARLNAPTPVVDGARPTSSPRDVGAALSATLDRLVAIERARGGWTFAAPPGARPLRSTAVMKIAERVAAPFGLADWDLVVMRSPGTPAAALAPLDGYERSGRAAYLEGAARPAQGRRFEPPALASWESRYAVEALVALADATGDRRYCTSIDRALAWLASSPLRPGCWPRFCDVTTNAPIYIGSDGAMVATPELARPGYDWTGDFGISALLARFADRRETAARDADVARSEIVARDDVVRTAALAPGDPGTRPGDPARGYAREAPNDARVLTARAVALRSALTSTPPSICARP